MTIQALHSPPALETQLVHLGLTLANTLSLVTLHQTTLTQLVPHLIMAKVSLVIPLSNPKTPITHQPPVLNLALEA